MLGEKQFQEDHFSLPSSFSECTDKGFLPQNNLTGTKKRLTLRILSLT